MWICPDAYFLSNSEYTEPPLGGEVPGGPLSLMYLIFPVKKMKRTQDDSFALQSGSPVACFEALGESMW